MFRWFILIKPTYGSCKRNPKREREREKVKWSDFQMKAVRFTGNGSKQKPNSQKNFESKKENWCLRREREREKSRLTDSSSIETETKQTKRWDFFLFTCGSNSFNLLNDIILITGLSFLNSSLFWCKHWSQLQTFLLDMCCVFSPFVWLEPNYQHFYYLLLLFSFGKTKGTNQIPFKSFFLLSLEVRDGIQFKIKSSFFFLVKSLRISLV